MGAQEWFKSPPVEADKVPLQTNPPVSSVLCCPAIDESASYRRSQMGWVVKGIKWIMFVAAHQSLSVIYAAIASGAAPQSRFGRKIEGHLAGVIVRNVRIL